MVENLRNLPAPQSQDDLLRLRSQSPIATNLTEPMIAGEADASSGLATHGLENVCTSSKQSLQVLLCAAGLNSSESYTQDNQDLNFVMYLYGGLVAFVPSMLWVYCFPKESRGNPIGLIVVFLPSFITSLIGYIVHRVYLRRLRRKRVIEEMASGLTSDELLHISFASKNVCEYLQRIEDPELLPVLVEYRDRGGTALDRKTQIFQRVMDETIIRLLNKITHENVPLLSNKTLSALAEILKRDPYSPVKEVKNRRITLQGAIVKISVYYDDPVLKSAVIGSVVL